MKNLLPVELCNRVSGMVIGGVKSLFIEDEDESIFRIKRVKVPLNYQKESQKIESLKKRLSLLWIRKLQ